MDILETKTILVVTITTMEMKITVPMINSRTVTTNNIATTTSTTITIFKAAMKNKMVMMGAMYSQMIGQFMNHSSLIHPGHLFLN